jgi:type I restriction enzyme S subunit
MSLVSLFSIKNGYTPSKANNDYWTDGNIPWFRMDDIRENGRVLSDSIQHISETAVKGGLFKADSIIIATSATIGEHALITSPFLANQRFTILTVKKEYEKIINIKFFFYYCFIIDEWCKENLTIGHFATVDMSRFKKISVPIPSLSEQARIVEILDKFDTLTTDITKGLPAEIAARQKQYEYYRDKLLTFMELTA